VKSRPGIDDPCRGQAPARGGASRRRARRRRARGQSSAEYLIVLALLAIALAIGPDSPLELLFRAFGDHYQKFSYAISRP